MQHGRIDLGILERLRVTVRTGAAPRYGFRRKHKVLISKFASATYAAFKIEIGNAMRMPYAYAWSQMQIDLALAMQHTFFGGWCGSSCLLSPAGSTDRGGDARPDFYRA